VSWLPFQLNPDLPASGIARADYLTRKFGSPDISRYQRVAEVGLTVGIHFSFNRIQMQPNTFNAHRLIHFAATRHLQDAVVERIFHAYFIQGLNLCDEALLIQCAVDVGNDTTISKFISYLKLTSLSCLNHKICPELKET
jgi:predicted DsbA family dithiol-disulfide isomerase